ncbi:MAG: hypothetical protein ACREQ7_10965 [Candidatus Binatia bacterium]
MDWTTLLWIIGIGLFVVVMIRGCGGMARGCGIGKNSRKRDRAPDEVEVRRE